MFIHWLTYTIGFLFVFINAQKNAQQSSISNNTKIDCFIMLIFFFLEVAVHEHQANNVIANDSDDQSWQTTTERTLIR